MPVLTALRDENMKQGNLVPLEGSSSGGQTTNLPSSSSTCGSPEDENIKLARLLQDEYWQRKVGVRVHHQTSSLLRLMRMKLQMTTHYLPTTRTPFKKLMSILSMEVILMHFIMMNFHKPCFITGLFTTLTLG